MIFKSTLFMLSSIIACEALTADVDLALVKACFDVNPSEVAKALRNGANVNCELKTYEPKEFRDKWDLGYKNPSKMTPLFALSRASIFPDPPRPVTNTLEDLNWAREQSKNITAASISERLEGIHSILLILLSHNCKIDVRDNEGANPLYFFILQRNEKCALLLVELGADVNVSVKTRIDDANDLTPLHRSFWSTKLTESLIAKGANINAKSSDGISPKDHAQKYGDKSVIELYKQAK